ncbi:MAG: hypothetical protein LBM94_01225 [Propionibacteriaceae bacterium]|jgi:hypothetical protein|nr:hypothetical protein [Propionibacteriaceae bacterium]
MRLSKTLAVTLVTALAIGFAGCSSDDAPPSASGSSSATTAPTQTTATATVPGESAPATTTQTTTAPGGPVNAATLAAQLGSAMGKLEYVAVNAETAIAYDANTMVITSEMRMDLTNPAETRAVGTMSQSGASFDVIMVGSKIYMKMDTQPWAEYPTDQVNTGTEANYGETYWNDMFVGGITFVGAEDVNGAPTMHYRSLGGNAEDGMTILSFDIWVNATGRCVKNQLKATLVQETITAELTSTTSFFDFDVPVTIEAPI